MFGEFLTSLVIISSLSGGSLPEALEVSESQYLIPTFIPISARPGYALEWRLEPRPYITFLEPTKTAPTTEDFPDISARSSVIMDKTTGQILWQKNPDQQVSIASITKLMTVLVWFDHPPAEGLQHVHEFQAEDDTPGGKELDLPYGEKLTADNLLHSSLIASYNDAALALSHTSPLSDEEFIAEMNTKAQALNMTKTEFVDQTGLEVEDLSVPGDIALLARQALSKPGIQEITAMPNYTQETVDSKQKSYMESTDLLLQDKSLNIIGGKTGYTEEAGYCVVVQARDPRTKHDIIVVVLGAPTDQDRFTQAKQLIQWTFTHYAWN